MLMPMLSSDPGNMLPVVSCYTDQPGRSLADLVDPVRVEDPKTAKLAPCPLLCHTFQVSCGLQLCDTLPHRLTIYNTLHARHLLAEGNVLTVDWRCLLSSYL